ncbi:MAG TPA: hypothetical protein VMV14_07745, partial [Acidimicrobiales bacterium]|nr:hypothetical protein [Acidimicrobiales bacterium]
PDPHGDHDTACTGGSGVEVVEGIPVRRPAPGAEPATGVQADSSAEQATARAARPVHHRARAIP